MSIFLVDYENVNSKGLNGINKLEETDVVLVFYSENADSMTFDLHEQINRSKAHIVFHKVDVGVKNALDFQLATFLGYMICEKEMAKETPVYYLVSRDRGYVSLVTYWEKRGINITQIGSLASGKIVWGEVKDEAEDESDSVEAESEESEAEGEPDSVEAEGEESEAEGEPDSVEAEGGEPEDEESEAEDEESEESGDKKPKGAKKGNKKEASPEEDALRVQVENAVQDREVVDLVVSYIRKYKTKLGINNALAKEFKDSKRASEIYKAIKPLIANKKGQ